MRIRLSMSFACMLLGIAVAFGQIETAQISGHITDPTGAAIPGANVVAINLATQVEKKDVSNTEGYYTLPLLPPGEYRLSIAKEGFRQYLQPGITLQVNQSSYARRYPAIEPVGADR